MDLTNHLKVAEHAVKIAMALLEKEGPVHLEGDELFAGETLLNENKRIVDEVYEATLFGCTIFLGNVRIATRATARGSTARALGTRANEEITESVYHHGNTFSGVTETLGKQWVIVYVPLDDHEGKRVGMVAAYRELKTFR